MGSKWFFKSSAPYQLSLTVDMIAARSPQLFILQNRKRLLEKQRQLKQNEKNNDNNNFCCIDL
jgi:hypothetical protein